MGKTDIDVKEAEQEKLAAQQLEVASGLAARQQQLNTVKAENQKVEALAKLQRARTISLRSVIEDQTATLENHRADQRRMRRELEESEGTVVAERGALSASRQAQNRLLEARASLIAVREELAKLASDEARQAALAAAGGDIPPEVVLSTPSLDTSAVGFSDPVELWQSSGARGEVPDAVRLVCTSQGVIAALQRSLTVRAAEMREGLRQWSFARSARARTEELLVGLRSELNELTERSLTLSQESGKLQGEHKAESSTLPTTKQQDSFIKSKNEALGQQLQNTRAELKRLKTRRDAVLQSLEESKQLRRQIGFEHEEAGRQLEGQQVALGAHAGEAERQATTAEKLSRRMQEQAQKGLQDLSQAATNLASFQQAHEALKAARARVEGNIEAERRAKREMVGQQERLNAELEALAKYYLEALPPMPGLEAPTPVPSRPSSSLAAAALVLGRESPTLLRAETPTKVFYGAAAPAAATATAATAVAAIAAALAQPPPVVSRGVAGARAPVGGTPTESGRFLLSF